VRQKPSINPFFSSKPCLMTGGFRRCGRLGRWADCHFEVITDGNRKQQRKSTRFAVLRVAPTVISVSHLWCILFGLSINSFHMFPTFYLIWHFSWQIFWYSDILFDNSIIFWHCVWQIFSVWVWRNPETLRAVSSSLMSTTFLGGCFLRGGGRSMELHI